MAEFNYEFPTEGGKRPKNRRLLIPEKFIIFVTRYCGETMFRNIFLIICPIRYRDMFKKKIV